MGKVVALFPRDQDIGALYAEALMDTQPWDYWEAGGTQSKGRAGEILATLERVLKDNPDHSGAIHYYGLAEVYKQRGDKVGEEATRKLFNNAWAEQGGTLDLAKL